MADYIGHALAKGVDLLKSYFFDARLFKQFAARGLIKRFLDSNKTTRKGPLAAKWLESSLDQANFVCPGRGTGVVSTAPSA